MAKPSGSNTPPISERSATPSLRKAPTGIIGLDEGADAESNRLRGDILGQVSDSVIAVDMEQRVTFFNTAAQRQYGMAASEVLGSKITDIYTVRWHNDDDEATAHAALREHGKWRGEHVHITRSGSEIHVESTVSVLRDGGHDETGIVSVLRDITGRKRVETALRESESRKSAILDSSLDGIITMDHEGKVIDFNPGAERTFGIRREDIVGDKLAERIIPERLRARHYQGLAHYLTTGEGPVLSKRIEVPALHADGHEFTIELSINRIANIEPPMFTATLRDITERQRMEETIRSSEDRFRAAIKAVSDVIWTNNAQGQMEGEQPSWGHFTGQTVDEYQNYGWAAAVHPDDAQPTINAWELAVAEKHMFQFEHRVRRHDGEWRRCSIRAVPILAANGQVREWVGVHTDITESKQVEAALRESAEFNRSIIESSRDCVKVLDLEGRLLSMSEAGQRLLGIADITPLIGMFWQDFWEGEDRRAATNALDAAVAGSAGNFTGYYTSDHRTRWWDVVITPITRTQGEPEKLLAIARDVTQRVLSEQKLKSTADELARSSRAKDDFLAALSHELRTPLTPVLMTATALETDPALSPELREQLSMMRRNIELEARLIDDLLDLTRISRGKMKISPVPTSVHVLLEHTAEIVRSEPLGKQVDIAFNLDAQSHHTLADPTRLQQVFWNLIKNALKFTATGGRVVVSTRNDPGGKLTITVTDTGIGISAEALPNVFNAFEQGDVAGQHRYGGLGLGLAISRAIVEAHGGSILAESRGHQQGALFSVILDTMEAPAAETCPEPANSPPVSALRLLLIEDHEATRTVLARLLTRRGYHVVTASTVAQALAIFAAEPFDGVISDHGLPDGSGIDLMLQIQSIRPVPGIALSGYGMEGDLQRSKQAGFFAHLVKPVNIDQLKQLLDQMPAHMTRIASVGTTSTSP